jgi:hypothetical protein
MSFSMSLSMKIRTTPTTASGQTTEGKVDGGRKQQDGTKKILELGKLLSNSNFR